MAEHQNVALLKKGYTAFNDADMATISELFDQAMIFHVAGQSQISGDYDGRDSVFGFFGKLAELTGGTIKIVPHDFLANDEHGVVLLNVTGTREGNELNMMETHAYHLKDGKVTEAWLFPFDQAEQKIFWS